MLSAKLNKPFSLHLPGNTLPLLANGLMLALLSYLFSEIGTQILKLLHPETETVFIVDTANIPGRVTVSAGNMSNMIASMHLFGNPAIATAQPVKKQIIAPETRLNLTLRGIVAKNHKHQGLAIIQNNDDRKEHYFAINQAVFGQARLEEIYEDRVILLRNGKYETLRLPEEALAKGDFIDHAAVKKERKRIATNFRKLLLNRDGMELIKLFGFDTAYKNGGFAGFVIKSLGEKGKEMMQTLGVEDGDLITVVNGKRLSESLEAVASLKNLKTANSVNIMIERHGTEMPFHFEFDESLATVSDRTNSAEGLSDDSLNEDIIDEGTGSEDENYPESNREQA